MPKKILAIYYSQTGQLGDIIHRFCRPFVQAGDTVETISVKPKQDYPFPWTTKKFFGVMPDCQLSVPIQIIPFTLQEEKYDLIVLGFQPWFLSPSIPFNSFIQIPAIQKVLNNTPTIVITAGRNMWVNAYERIKIMLHKANAKQVGTIALMDRHLNLVSFFTIFHWMLHGKKDKYLNIFPKPGVSEKDISNAENFGKIALPHLRENEWENLQQKFYDNDAIFLKYHLAFIEKKAGAMFRVWARFISKRKNKALWLSVFKYYLIIALFIFAPVVYVVNLLIFKPFFSKQVKKRLEAILKLS